MESLANSSIEYEDLVLNQKMFDAQMTILKEHYGERIEDVRQYFTKIEDDGETYYCARVRPISFEKLATVYNPPMQYNLPQYPEYILHCLEETLMIIDLWIRRQKEMAEFFEQEVYDESMYYQNNLNKELLELYIKCKKEIPTRRYKHNEVSLSINKGFRKNHKRVRIPNFDNWLFRAAIPQYIEQCYPTIKSVEDAEIVLSHLRRAGRPNDVEFLNEVIYGTYRLIHDFDNSKVKVPLNECKIINCYVRFIGLVDKDNDVIDELNIAARIREIEKHNKQEQMVLNTARRLNINTLDLIDSFLLNQSLFLDLRQK